MSMERKRKRRIVYCESQNRSRQCKKIRARTLSFLGYGTHTYKPNGKWNRFAEDMMLNFIESGHPYSVDQVLRNELCEAKEKENCLYIYVVTTTQLDWFFAQSFPPISSVSSEAVADMCDELACRISGCRETCCSNQFRDHGDANRIDGQRTKRLGPMRRCTETCCTITNKNSQIFQIIFN